MTISKYTDVFMGVYFTFYICVRALNIFANTLSPDEAMLMPFGKLDIVVLVFLAIQYIEFLFLKKEKT